MPKCEATVAVFILSGVLREVWVPKCEAECNYVLSGDLRELWVPKCEATVIVFTSSGVLVVRLVLKIEGLAIVFLWKTF